MTSLNWMKIMVHSKKPAICTFYMNSRVKCIPDTTMKIKMIIKTSLTVNTNNST